MYYARQHGMGFIDPVSLVSAGSGLITGVASLFKKDDSAEEQRKAAEALAKAQIYQSTTERKVAIADQQREVRTQQVTLITVAVVGAIGIAALLVWQGAKRRSRANA